MKSSFFKSIAIASLGLAVLSSCNKNEIGGPEREDGQMKLSVTGVLGEYKASEGTKASLVNTPRVGWNGSETVHVFQQSDGKYLGPLTSSVKTADASVATLSGTISLGTGTLVFVYNGNASTPSLTAGTTYTSLEISLAEQGTDIPFVVYGTADSPGTTTVSGLVVNFNFATSVVSTYAAGLPPSKSVAKATLSSINTKCILNICNTTTAGGSESGTITKTTGIGGTNAEGQVLFDIAVPVSDAVNPARSIGFMIDNESYTAGFSGTAIVAGMAYSAMSENHSVEGVVLNKTSTTIFPGATETLTATVYPKKSDPALIWESSNTAVATVNGSGEVTGISLGTATITATSQDDPSVKAGCTVTVDNHRYVVIGGLKWATCNIGADSPAGYGWYFSWGNTEGYVYNDSKWVKASDNSKPLGNDGSFSSTNYNNTPGHSLSGDISPASVNDAARINWGGDWRMPSSDEFKALYQACGGTGASGTPTELSSSTLSQGIYWLTKEQTYIPDYTNVAGLLFVDENQNKLFFPATGHGHETYLNEEGIYGAYWSSTYVNSNISHYMTFKSNNFFANGVQNTRFTGSTVRPVSD